MTPAVRAATLCGFIGHPWQANAKGPDAFDCWHLAAAVSRTLFDRELPDVEVPPEPTWVWLIDTIRDHPERQRWREVAPGTPIKAGDGSLVLMARRDRPAHVGLWLVPERRILHADPRHGSVCEAPVELRTKGWTKLRFFEPLDNLPTR